MRREISISWFLCWFLSATKQAANSPLIAADKLVVGLCSTFQQKNINSLGPVSLYIYLISFSNDLVLFLSLKDTVVSEANY